jgi:SAM-dependent MidA family methyltransferase
MKKGKSPFAGTPSANKSEETALVRELKNQIHLRGPLSMAEWMQFCLGHPQHGYYMQRDAIGKRGDFITNPEISSVYSEMVAIWCVSSWMKLGRPSKFQIIECGPGRGTLMKDLLSAAESFPEFYNAISVHFVENSGVMRELQRQAMGVELDQAVYDKENSQDAAVAKQNAKLTKKIQETRLYNQQQLARIRAAKAAEDAKDGKPGAPALERVPLVDAQGVPIAGEVPDVPEDPILALTRQVEQELGLDSSALASGVGEPEQYSSMHPYAPDDLDPRAVMTRPRVFGSTGKKFASVKGAEDTETATAAAQAEQPLFGSKRLGGLSGLKDSLDVSWHWTIAEVPSTAPCVVIGHEFFDALPVHQFKYTERGWREVLVDLDNSTGPHHFKYVLSPEPTPASLAFATPMHVFSSQTGPEATPPGARKVSSEDTMARKFDTTSFRSALGGIARPMIAPNKSVSPLHPSSTDARLVSEPGVAANARVSAEKLAHDAFPGVEALPHTISGAKARHVDADDADSSAPAARDDAGDDAASIVSDVLRMAKNDGTGKADKPAVTNSADVSTILQQPHRVGDTYEISPAALIWMEQITLRLARSRDAPVNAFAVNLAGRVFRDLSLQGIKEHGHADVLQEPGLVDLSAHVNFGVLGAVAKRTVKQLNMLLAQPRNSPEYRKALSMLGIRAGDAPPQVGFGAGSDVLLHDVEVYPAIAQSAFLQQLGLEQRFETLIGQIEDEEEKKNFFLAVNRLVDPEQMGDLFKVMALMSKDARAPVGWDKDE